MPRLLPASLGAALLLLPFPLRAQESVSQTQPAPARRPVALPPAVPVQAAAPLTATSAPDANEVATTQPNIYDPNADARQQIATALAVARRENQRVLLMFGGNWCIWCRRLHGLFTTDKDIKKLLQYEYQLVMVDIGRRDKNADLAQQYDADLKKFGVPYLTVLSADGKLLANQETSALEEGNGHNPAKVKEFLEKWKAEPQDAEKLLTAALERARTEKKLVFLHFGAPWCPWCRRLDAFLARPQVAAILAPEFIDLKIDMDRMKNAADVARRCRPREKDTPAEKASLPWFEFLDGASQVLATSNLGGPSGANIGFPAEPKEIEHFMGMLDKTLRPIAPAQLMELEKLLRAEAKR